MAIIRNKSQVVLWSSHQANLVYAPGDDDFPMVILDHDAWEDMGRPVQITVTIEPGDKLND